MSSSRISFVVRMQRWMDSVPGQTFLNYAYSWGAAIVILGTLFKLTHLAGANLMLFIGMGTEVVVFFLSAFDRPFDKTADTTLAESLVEEGETEEGSEGATAIIGGAGGGAIIIGGGAGGASAAEGDASEIIGGGQPIVVGSGVQGSFVQTQADLTPDLESASKDYVEMLRQLTETLERVEKQSARLTTDSEEMTNLNRTLTGINTVYELQLKGISQQVGSIDRINEQTRLMAEQIEELNGIYARMIKALTVNMKNAATQTGNA